MPYDGKDATADDFSDQLLAVEDLINNNLDCHVIVGGDFNVDFTRDRLYTALLASFCANFGLRDAAHHNKSTIDYSYNFNSDRFSTLDHFLISHNVFDNLLHSAYAVHDADNLSDHEPIVVKFLVDFKYGSFIERAYSSHISWYKASESNICD